MFVFLSRPQLLYYHVIASDFLTDEESVRYAD